MSFVKEFFSEYRFEFSIAFPVLALLLSLIFWFSFPKYYYDLIFFKIGFLSVDIIVIILFIFCSPIRFYHYNFQNTVNIDEPNNLSLNKGDVKYYFIKVVFGKRKLQKLKNAKNKKYEIIIEKANFIQMQPNDLIPGHEWDDADPTRCRLICTYNMEKELNIVFKIFTTLSLSEIQPNLKHELIFYFKKDKEEKIYEKDVEITTHLPKVSHPKH